MVHNGTHWSCTTHKGPGSKSNLTIHHRLPCTHKSYSKCLWVEAGDKLDRTSNTGGQTSTHTHTQPVYSYPTQASVKCGGNLEQLERIHTNMKTTNWPSGWEASVITFRLAPPCQQGPPRDPLVWKGRQKSWLWKQPLEFENERLTPSIILLIYCSYNTAHSGC